MNKQQREIAKLNRKERKNDGNRVFATNTQYKTHGKKHTVDVTANDHSAFAFMEPAEAKASKRQRGIKSWRVSGKHPANQKVQEVD